MAIIEDSTGTVTNLIALEPDADWSPPPGHSVVPADKDAVLGGTWDGTSFTRPAVIPPDLKVDRRLVLEERMYKGLASRAEIQEFLVLRHGIVAP